MADFLVLTRADIEPLLGLAEAIDCVERAFLQLAAGDATLFPVIREAIPPYGGFFGVKAGYLRASGVLGYKGGGFWAGNAAKGLAGHQSVIVLYDPSTGVPRAALDGNYITVIRTGAAGAIAARLLARADSRVAAIIGAGTQGSIQLAALRHVLPIKEVRCYDADPAAVARFTAPGLHVLAAASVRDAVTGADVIVTATPSFAPLIEAAWIAPGTHISAFGADTRGKQELAIDLVVAATVVADHLPQARDIGECQHAFRSGRITAVHAELGDVLSGTKPGRTSANEITVFDATGIALQDIAVAARVCEIAAARGIGTTLRLDS